MQNAAVMQLYDVSSCSGPVGKAAALVFLLYLPDMKLSSEVDHTVAHSSLDQFEQFTQSLCKWAQLKFLAQGECLSDWIDSKNSG